MEMSLKHLQYLQVFEWGVQNETHKVIVIQRKKLLVSQDCILAKTLVISTMNNI